MNTVHHWIEKGFVHYADITINDRLKQGVDVQFKNESLAKITKNNKRAAVYIITEKTTGRVLKFGQSANIHQRIFTNYKCTINSTNNFVRENIKNRFKHVSFFVYLIPNKQVELIGYNFKTNLQKGLEEAILKEYAKAYGEVPELNKQLN